MKGHLFIDAVPTSGKVRHTPQGGIEVPAYLTRTGIFNYVVDGKVIRALRHPDDVFEADSLATLRHAPVTVYHPEERVVTSENYCKLSVGHVHDAARKGDYVASDVVVQDADTVKGVLSRHLCEFSCGYHADWDETPGTYGGAPYDVRQTNIRYNHVAIGPKNWGRAGPDVKVQLDSKSSTQGTNYIEGDNMKDVIHTDEGTVAAPAVLDASQFISKADHAEAVNKLTLDHTRAIDKVTGERDVLKSANAQLQADLAAEKLKNSPATLDSKLAERAALLDSAKVLAGDKFTCDAKDEVGIMTAALKAADPKLSLDGKSADYVRAAFDLSVAKRKEVVDSHADVASLTRTPLVEDSEDELAKAQAAFNKRYAAAH